MSELFHDLPFNIPDAKRGEVLTACSARHKGAVQRERERIQCPTQSIWTYETLDVNDNKYVIICTLLFQYCDNTDWKGCHLDKSQPHVLTNISLSEWSLACMGERLMLCQCNHPGHVHMFIQTKQYNSYIYIYTYKESEGSFTFSFNCHTASFPTNQWNVTSIVLHKASWPSVTVNLQLYLGWLQNVQGSQTVFGFWCVLRNASSRGKNHQRRAALTADVCRKLFVTVNILMVMYLLQYSHRIPNMSH